MSLNCRTLVLSNINEGFDIYDTPSGVHRRTLKVRMGLEHSDLPAIFIHNGNTVVLCGTADGEAFVWDINEGDVLGTLEHPGLQ